MSLPSATITPGDFGLVAVPSSAAKVVAKIGACSAGVPLAVSSWSGPNLTAMQAALGAGPLVEAAAESLQTGGGPIITVPATASAAGAVGTVVHTGTGTSVMTVTGTPNDGYSLKAQIIKAAASIAGGGGSFQYSLDGTNWSKTVAMPTSGTYAIPGTGLTLNFGTGTLVAADLYAAPCTAPAPSVSDVAAALDALIASQYRFGCVHVVGAPAPSASAATKTGTGVMAAPVITGTPTAYIDAVYKITTGGMLNTCQAALSLDGGLTYGAPATIPTGGVMTTSGLTVTFAAGTYILNDLFSFNTYGGLASLFASVDAKMSAAAAAFKWCFAIIEAPDCSDAILAKAVASLASSQGRVMVAGGTCQLASATAQPGGSAYRRPDAWPIAARVASSEISDDLGRVRSGPIGDVVSMNRDEQLTPGLGALHMETLRTIPGRNGVYIASDSDGNMMSALGSDYSLVQFRRVMDRACTVALPVVQSELNDDLFVNPKTGFLLETEARRIEGEVEAAVKADLLGGKKGHCSAVKITVKRDEPVLVTKNITIDVAIVPKSYAKSVTTTLHYALSVALP